jgi:hypothetical protein
MLILKGTATNEFYCRKWGLRVVYPVCTTRGTDRICECFSADKIIKF